MTVNDPGTPTSTEIKRTYGAEPEKTVIHTTEVRESSAAWWIGALVAIVAILAVVFLVTRSPADDQAQIADAIEQGRLQGALESTQSSLDSAQTSATIAAQSAADATARAAADARAATERAADAATAAADRAADAADRAVTPPLVEPVG